jgi:hypothetical protein
MLLSYNIVCISRNSNEYWIFEHLCGIIDCASRIVDFLNGIVDFPNRKNGFLSGITDFLNGIIGFLNEILVSKIL